MPSKAAPVSTTSYPLVGTLIDDDSLKLVEILGVGGYGVVYRAEDTYCDPPASYAVKCLMHTPERSQRQRQVHIREIALHQIASAHPNVATLHRVYEDEGFTYIIMEFAPDNDLFTQILNNCRYLGEDQLIRHVFVQLLDAVEYCHSMGIYHRDLKPENVLCFEDGLRVAVTDFGLATTDKLSDEFRTGSIYHMSPECQGGDFAPTGTYSPMFNDVWSLGIILLNLATGRNPWKSATLSDPTFQAYLRDPYGFLPTVLPISPELNNLLVRMLEVDWRDRLTISEVREALDDISTFYSDGVVFQGSMARCPWEATMDLDEPAASQEDEEDEPAFVDSGHLKSRWSNETTSDIVFAEPSMDGGDSCFSPMWTEFSDETAWATTSGADDLFTKPHTVRSTLSNYSSAPSSSRPPSPHQLTEEIPEVHLADAPTALSQLQSLRIDTNLRNPHYYGNNVSMHSRTTGSSLMHTAVEYDPYSSSFFLASPASPSKYPTPMLECTYEEDDPGMRSMWLYSGASSEYSPTKTMDVEPTPYVQQRSSAPSPDTIAYTDFPVESPTIQDQDEQYTPSFQAAPPRPLSPTKKRLASGLFSMKFFPRSTSIASSQLSPVPDGDVSRIPGSLPSFTFSETTSPSTPLPSWVDLTFTRTEAPGVDSPMSPVRDWRRNSPFRSARHWFLPAKLFPSSVMS